VWLPAFKFLGLGMILGGVTFLLATILGYSARSASAAAGSKKRCEQKPESSTLP